jgi:hypothetical protein
MSSIFFSKVTGEYILAIPKCGWSLSKRSRNQDKSPCLRELPFRQEIFYCHDILVREPVARFKSCIRDKFVREGKKYTGSHEVKAIAASFGIQPEEVCLMSIDDILDRVEDSIPKLRHGSTKLYKGVLNEHLQPQVYQIEEYADVDSSTRLRDIRHDKTWLSELGINSDIRFNSTKEIRFPLTEAQEARIEYLYADDVALYEKYKRQVDDGEIPFP